MFYGFGPLKNRPLGPIHSFENICSFEIEYEHKIIDSSGYIIRLSPRIIPAINKNGNNNQVNKTINPARNIDNSDKRPKAISILLTIAPMTRDIILDRATSTQTFKSKPLPYDQLYLCQ